MRTITTFKETVDKLHKMIADLDQEITDKRTAGEDVSKLEKSKSDIENGLHSVINEGETEFNKRNLIVPEPIDERKSRHSYMSLSEEYVITSNTSKGVRLDLANYSSNKVYGFFFDNEKGAVKVIGNKEETDIAWIPFSEIDHFSSCTRVRVLSSRSSSENSELYYYTLMHLKNLGAWKLFESIDNSDVWFELSELKRGAHLGEALKTEIVYTLPASIKVTANGDTTILRWHNIVKVPVAISILFRTVLSAGMIAFYFSMTKNTFMKNYLFESFMNVAIGLILFILITWFVVVTIRRLRNMISDMFNMYCFSFNATEVKFYKESLAGKKKKTSMTIPRDQWEGLLYPAGFADEKEDVVVVTTALAPVYRKKINDANTELDMGFALASDLARLRFTNLTPVQRLSTVLWITAEMKKRA